MDAGPRQLKAAIETVVADSAVRDGAVRLRDSFAAAGGPSLAADRLEALVGAGTLGAVRFTP
jgi:UDP:flavonoid glycosyltransferase YjiC (YdhE family)